MRHHPTRSTLFPYTTLFRSPGSSTRAPTMRPRPSKTRESESCSHSSESHTSPNARSRRFRQESSGSCCWRGRRSEEHTSELQSRQYLVCRLLLEKKNKYNML